MKKILCICFLSILFLSACLNEQLVNLVLSETQTQGLQEVANTYGCEVTWKKAVGSSSDEGNYNRIELQIDSVRGFMQYLTEHQDLLSTCASVLYYKELAIQEKENMTHVKVVLPKTDGTTVSYSYPTALLDTMVDMAVITDKLVGYLQKNDVKSIFAMLEKPDDLKGQELCSQQLKDDLETFGNINGYQLLGFRYFFFENGEEAVRLFATLLCEKKPVLFSVDFMSHPDGPELTGFRYKHKFSY